MRTYVSPTLSLRVTSSVGDGGRFASAASCAEILARMRSARFVVWPFSGGGEDSPGLNMGSSKVGGLKRLKVARS